MALAGQGGRLGLGDEVGDAVSELGWFERFGHEVVGSKLFRASHNLLAGVRLSEEVYAFRVP